jgi:hypothetical protein
MVRSNGNTRTNGPAPLRARTACELEAYQDLAALFFVAIARTEAARDRIGIAYASQLAHDRGVNFKDGMRCPMSTRDDQLLIEKLRSLPPQRRAEVEDFVDFLKSREDEQRLTRAAAQASEPAFKSVWDNPDDAEYDRL